jgi:hypothetical protein
MVRDGSDILIGCAYLSVRLVQATRESVGLHLGTYAVALVSEETGVELPDRGLRLGLGDAIFFTAHCE